MRLRPITLLVLCAMWSAPAVVAAQTASTAPDETSAASPAASRVDGRDLYLDMPYALGGYEPDIVMTRGEEHFANLAVDDEARVELESFLQAVGADIADMDSGYALVSQDDLFSFVVAIRVWGVEPGALLPAYLPTLYGDLVDPSASPGRVGGKDVLVISSVGDDGEYVDLTAYDQGDTIWLLQGPPDVVETAVANLPAPA